MSRTDNFLYGISLLLVETLKDINLTNKSVIDVRINALSKMITASNEFINQESDTDTKARLIGVYNDFLSNMDDSILIRALFKLTQNKSTGDISYIVISAKQKPIDNDSYVYKIIIESLENDIYWVSVPTLMKKYTYEGLSSLITFWQIIPTYQDMVTEIKL